MARRISLSQHAGERRGALDRHPILTESAAPPFVIPERSRGICDSAGWSWKCFSTEQSAANNLIFMKKLSITVTEAARNFADCVNRARYQDVTFVLLKNGVPVAQLAPSSEKVCFGRDLAAILAKARLTDKESKAWRIDLQASRQALKRPENKWK
jgi:antitoxin (DNA-binding transcriptional repressor) of toxin-antitoxin stability system